MFRGSNLRAELLVEGSCLVLVGCIQVQASEAIWRLDNPPKRLSQPYFRCCKGHNSYRETDPCIWAKNYPNKVALRGSISLEDNHNIRSNFGPILKGI